MSKPTPLNIELYNRVKEEIYKKYPVHSAYRSGLIVKTYKQLGGEYSGKKNKNEGLNLWFKSKWLNQNGQVGYHSKSDVYRPTVKVNDKTPTTFQELTKKEIERARREKYLKGHVKKFKQNN